MIAGMILRNDRTCRTSLRTGKATVTKRIVDRGKIVLHLDRPRLADLFALTAANTTVFAKLPRFGSGIAARAQHGNTYRIGEQVDQPLRTGITAKAATDTGARVDTCHVIHDADCILRTSGSTITVADTTKGTGGRTAVKKLGGSTTFDPVITVVSGRNTTPAITGDRCDHLAHIKEFTSERIRKRTRNSITAGNTKIGGKAFVLKKCLCVTVTARITAGTAIDTRQTGTKSLKPSVAFYRQKTSGKHKQEGQKNTENKQ